MHEPLTGITQKLDRADEHVSLLDAEIRAYLGRDLYKTVSAPDPERKEIVVRLVGPLPPLRFSVIAGEIVHQLRSALDHLVWQLVLQNGDTPGRNTQFPICETPEAFSKARKRGTIRGVSDDACRLIEARQPYHTKGRDHRWHPLWIVQGLDNIDKHRLLVVVTAAAKPTVVSVGSAQGDLEIIGLSPPEWPVAAVPEGVELLRVTFDQFQPDAHADVELSVDIVLEEFGPLSHQPLIAGVQELTSKVRSTIELFADQFTSG